jgi:DNA helicase-2/ATP-dependent DNA helicase PcrA
MKLPTESQLSREQREVMNAPTEGTILVVGPPGSGKTVVAVLRERALNRRKALVTSVVFTNVLSQYTGSGNGSTFHKWLPQWWRTCTGSRFPATTITDDNGDSQWQLDYATAAELAAGALMPRFRSKGHWGHLILDEAQDFPPSAHKLLFLVQQRVFHDTPEDDRPSICILADENQRLTAHNSTIRQIRAAHPLLTDDEEYLLRRNYRNTRQIAEFAAHFYVGLESGKPDLPTTEGSLPRVIRAPLDASVDRVVTHAKNHADQEVGVLVRYDRTRRKVFNKLEFRLRQSGIKVQTYGSRSKEHDDATKLKFGKAGVVTVLCFSSAKGLEFDTVFLPELQTLPLGDGQTDHLRMNLYVMASRARRELWVTIDDEAGTHDIWSLLPPPHLWVSE